MRKASTVGMLGDGARHPSVRRQSAAVIGEILIASKVPTVRTKIGMSEIATPEMMETTCKATTAAAPEVCDVVTAEVPASEMSPAEVCETVTAKVPTAKMSYMATAKMVTATAKMVTAAAEVMFPTMSPSASRVCRHGAGQ